MSSHVSLTITGYFSSFLLYDGSSKGKESGGQWRFSFFDLWSMDVIERYMNLLIF